MKNSGTPFAAKMLCLALKGYNLSMTYPYEKCCLILQPLCQIIFLFPSFLCLYFPSRQIPKLIKDHHLFFFPHFSFGVTFDPVCIFYNQWSSVETFHFLKATFSLM